MEDKKVLSGGKLAGGNPKNERVEHDFYATNPKALEMLIDEYYFGRIKVFNPSTNALSVKWKMKFLEPCAGQGHLAKVIKERLMKSGDTIDCLDIVDRGYPDTIETNFLEYETDKKYDVIISNPPYSLGKEFIEKGLELLADDGKMAMFLKIQFLEGAKRKQMFKDNPPKYIYVFSNRMATWNNGSELDGNGKKWSTTMCHAFFIWEKGFKGEPIVRWL